MSGRVAIVNEDALLHDHETGRVQSEVQALAPAGANTVLIWCRFHLAVDRQ